MFSSSLSLSPTVTQQSFVQVIPVQGDRDAAVLRLLDKLSEVYRFIAQDEMRGEISSMHAILGKISQQTRECARFIKNYSETKKICEFKHATALCTVSSFYHYHREQTWKGRCLGNGRYDPKVQ